MDPVIEVNVDNPPDDPEETEVDQWPFVLSALTELSNLMGQVLRELQSLSLQQTEQSPMVRTLLETNTNLVGQVTEIAGRMASLTPTPSPEVVVIQTPLTDVLPQDVPESAPSLEVPPDDLPPVPAPPKARLRRLI